MAESLIKSVEKVTLTLTGTSDSVLLTQGQNHNYCVPFATWSRTDHTEAGHFIDVYMGAGPTVYAERGSSSGNAVLVIYVVEFEPAQVSIQTGTFSYGGTSGSSAISSVDTDKTFILTYYEWSGGSGYLYDSIARSRLTSSTNIEYTRESSAGTISGHYFVVEDVGNNFTVQHVDLDIINPATSDTVAITSVEEDKTFIIASYYNRYGAGRADYAAVSVWLSNATTVRAEQQLNSSYPANSHIRAQAISFTEFGSVQRSQQSWDAGDSTKNDTLSPAVDLAVTMAWIPVDISIEKTNSSESQLCWFSAELTSETNIKLTRQGTGATSTVSWEAVTWPFVIKTIPKGVIMRGVILR
jgi:hypothetical protein